MVEKRARGLPDSFSLNAAEDLPVSVGDFLDEEDVTKNQVLARRLAPAASAKEPVEVAPIRGLTQGLAIEPPPESPPVAALPTRAPEAARSPVALPEARPEPPKRPALHPAWKRPRRKQLNVSADAERMLESLLRHFQQYGPQEDIKMSELFEALVIVAHRSMDRLSLGELPRRGAWGSQTEKNFPSAVGEAIARAIAGEYAKWGEVGTG
jgi:hypothetical protein